jgi:hypothetical protein
MAADGTRLMSVVISMVMDTRWCDGAAWRCLATRDGWVVPRGVPTLRRASSGCVGGAAKLGKLLGVADKKREVPDHFGGTSDLRAISRRSQGGVGEKIIGRTGAVYELPVGAG